MSRKFYITTPIYYVNARPHIGHAYTTIACDTIARRQRMLGADTFFLTGTDEHGQKIQQTGAKEGLTPQQLLDRNVPRYRAMVERLNCSNDDFIRTTEERHYRSSEEIWRRMEQNGWLKSKASHEPSAPRRKEYRLTKDGGKVLKLLRTRIEELHREVVLHK